MKKKRQTFFRNEEEERGESVFLRRANAAIDHLNDVVEYDGHTESDSKE